MSPFLWRVLSETLCTHLCGRFSESTHGLDGINGGYMKKIKWKIVVGILVLLLAGVYYYVALPAINIHSTGFWVFLLVLSGGLLVHYIMHKQIYKDVTLQKGRFTTIHVKGIEHNAGLKVRLLLVGGILLVIAIGAVLSSPIVNAKKYRQLMKPETRDFTQDIKQVNYKQIPLLDKESAELLGNRKMGNMVDMVSQFEVSSIYSQINYKGTPVRVSPLTYASTVKWLTNQSEGIPAYIKIDMATQDTELVHLDEGIRYSQGEYLNRNINRHLRFNYPSYIFDQMSFEIDDDGVPYWICPVKKFGIGLFGGQTIGRVVLCNAITGETIDYAIEDCPVWVDRAYPADLLIELYDYHGSLINGYFNSIFGQKGCLKTTEGYNYLAMDDDVWVYTGVTSVSSDESNVGFILVNQRTMETRYYEVNGAEEYSAMASAEGQVQHLGYKAVFPMLLNISGEPTYMIALKDSAGLVKKYAMVNIQKYQIVAIGDSAAECEKAYLKLMNSSGISRSGSGTAAATEGVIEKIAQSVIEGNSHFYVTIQGDEKIYDIPVVDFVEIVKYDVGDWIQISYEEGDPLCIVTEIK